MLISWIFHFNNDISIIKKPVDENYNIGKKLDARKYRILVKYKQDEDSSILYFKEVIPNYASNEKKDISNYEKNTTEKKEQSNKSSYVSSGLNKEHIKNKSCMFETKIYSHMEKKIFKELDYMDFLQNNRTISDKFFRSVAFKKYRISYGQQ
ncbi:Plasmodium exported protein, unknown function [Plasmodium malariae]|uniref:Uncharacterized protein n=1 Tax=Plasmodium malariae TaxID=5858 RepID=A0A1A8WGB9_PLAMA|nr:Plasmodium exported protein, unknown function [Plasmodium malariae]